MTSSHSRSLSDAGKAPHGAARLLVAQRRHVRWLLCLTLLLMGAGPAATPGRRVALVMGNGAYQYMTQLRNPANDAREIAAKLRELGFEVVAKSDLRRTGMEDAREEFLRRAQGAEVALLYYSGHGISVHGGNYLFPVDARLPRDEYGVAKEAVVLESLVKEMQEAARVSLVLLDACRDNPLLERSLPGQARGGDRGVRLEGTVVGRGTMLVLYATRGGERASDGEGAAKNGPFAQALKEKLDERVAVQLLVPRVISRVRDLTKGIQQPEMQGTLDLEVYLAGVCEAGKRWEGGQCRVDQAAADESLWLNVSEMNRLESYRFYLAKFPQGKYVAAAKQRETALLVTPARPVVTEAAQPAPIRAPAAVDVEVARPLPPAAAPPSRFESSAPSSKTLERALQLYDAEAYYDSSIELNKVVERQAGDNEGNVQRAEFFMGKTLFNLKYYSMSLQYFTQIVAKGPTHRYYQKTLQWLASLSRFLPESAGVLEKIGKYNRQDFELPWLQPMRYELYYLLGRYHYSKGNFKDALGLLELVPGESEFFERASIMLGIIHTRDNNARSAGEAFKRVLRKDKDRHKTTRADMVDLANISLARVFYATEQYPLALKYYGKIPGKSVFHAASIYWPDAVVEGSWAYFQNNNLDKAMSNLDTVLKSAVVPEAYLLRATIHFWQCRYDRAMESVMQFYQISPALREEILAIIKKFPDNAEFYKYVLKIRSGEAGLSERVQRATGAALQDRTIAKTLDYVSEIDRELRQMDKATPSWKSTAISGMVLQDLTLQKSIAENEAGGLVRKRLERVAGEIQQLIKQAIKIEYETLQGQKGQLDAAIRAEQVCK